MDSAVPYSLSDIQLPDSPSNVVKPVTKAASKKESLPPHIANDSDKDSHSDNDVPRNGLNSTSKSHTKVKSVLDDASNKRKISVKEPKKLDHLNTLSKKGFKSSDDVAKSAFVPKNKQPKNEQVSDSEEKLSKKVKVKSYQSPDKDLESCSNSSNSEESSDSNGRRKRRQPRSKISVKQSMIPKNRSHSSSSSTDSSQSPKRIPEILSKEDLKNVKKKSVETGASRTVKKHKIESSNLKSSKSKFSASSPSSRSSQSRETTPVEPDKKEVKKAVVLEVVKKHHTESRHDRKTSKSRSRSPSNSQCFQSKDKKFVQPSKEDAKKSIELDASKTVRKHQSKSSSDQKTSKNRSDLKKSKSRSRSPTDSRSSHSRERSPVKPAKGDVKKLAVPDAPKIVRKRHTSSSDRKTSKSKSRSPSSQERNLVILSKDDVRKSIVSSASRKARNDHAERSPMKVSKEDVKKSDSSGVFRSIRKNRTGGSTDQKASKSRSRSPSSSQSRERSPMKASKEDIKKSVVSDASGKIRKDRSGSRSDQKTSKSRSRSPSSRKNRERSPLKASKEDIKKSVESDASRKVRKDRTGSSSGHKTSKSRSRSPSSSQSRERSPMKASKDLKESVMTDVSRKVRKDLTCSSSDQKTSKSRSHSPSSSREKSPVKASKEDVKVLIVTDASRSVKKDCAGNSSDHKTSKSRSRSPSSSLSRERSPVKTSKEDGKKLVGIEASRTKKRPFESEQKISKSRSSSASSSRSSQSQERSPVKSSKQDVEKSDSSRTVRKSRSESISDQKTSKSRSRSSSCSPPPHQTLELFFSQSKRSGFSKRNEGSYKEAPAATEQKSDLSSDPPRKKLKINRNNIIIPSLGSSEKVTIEESKKKSSNDKALKVSPSLQKEEKEQKESTSSIQFEIVEREMGEIIENSPEVKYEPRKINFPGRKLNRKSSDDLSSSEPKSKKSKWGKFASSRKSSQTINISTDSLKNWFPEFKLVNEPSVVNDSMPEESPPVKEDKKLSFPLKTEEESIQQTSSSASHQNNEEPTLVATESSGPVSKIVFIQNLVRPFTLLQLKDLLRQTGHFIEEDFWIDKIKSKCFVTYSTEEEAIKTRNALNGVRWPSSNPKILIAEFSTEEEFEHHRSGKDAQKPIPERLPEVQETYEEKIPQPASDHRRKERDSDKKKERERYRPQAPVREWDKDKVLQESPDREKADKNIEGFRGSDRKDKKDTKKRTNEDTPAKLLDDLFQKTKSVPCIYWLPLTEAQVLENEESRRLRRLEREKKNQQREKEESEHRNKRSQLDHKTREMDRRSSTRSRSPTSRRR